MSTAPSQPEQPTSSWRRIIIALLLVAVVIVVAGLVAGYLFFFGSDAPATPTLDDALQVLLPSASPR